MAMITLEEAKAYLRVDTSDEDAVIGALLASACRLCEDIARMTDERWNEVWNNMDDPDLIPVREAVRIAVFYALAYFFEHREEADHHALVMTLRSLLFAVREGVM